MSHTEPSTILAFAEDLLATGPHWLDFWRAVFGPGGAVDKAFPCQDTRAAWEATDDGRQVHAMLVELWRAEPAVNEDLEPTEMITVRLPRCIHRALRSEAHLHETSLNKLCVAKLLHAIEAAAVPK